MAASPSHKLGQLIGNLLEEVFSPRLQELASKSGLYLDVIGKKRKARKGKKITWEDAYGSSHDLDFVLELGGSEDAIGRPAARKRLDWIGALNIIFPSLTTMETLNKLKIHAI